jgi:radical SAM superfamily enzyme YgiQ (UPF0313 family)
MDKFKILFFFPNEPRVGVVPSNLAILSACLKSAGHDVKLFDSTLYQSIRYENKTETQDNIREKIGHTKKTEIDRYAPLKTTNIYNDFVNVINSYNPNIIAISLVDSTIQISYSFLELIKHKNIPVVVGGVGALYSYEKILKSGYVNYVCLGEGEQSLVELCNNLKSNKSTEGILNICYLDKKNNVIKPPLRELCNLDNLPVPDFSIYEDERFYRPFGGKVVRMAQFDLDRGCPYSCSYCAAPSLRNFFKNENAGKYYRLKNIDKFFNETKEIINKFNINFLYISSETLLALPYDKFKNFAERYIKEINLPFWCQTRLDSFTEEKTSLLKKMGCQSVSVGLEHGNENFRTKILNKKLSNESIFKGFELLAKYNIRPTINSMLGLPNETRELIFETIEMNRKISKILNGNHNINIFTFIPFSGTKLREISIHNGFIDAKTEISFSFYKESMLTMPQLSKEEISGLEKTAHLYIKLDKKHWNNIKLAEKNTEEGLMMFNKLNEIYNK